MSLPRTKYDGLIGHEHCAYRVVADAATVNKSRWIERLFKRIILVVLEYLEFFIGLLGSSGE